MKRCVLALFGVILVTQLFGWIVAAQPEVIDGFAHYDLQLISQESLPHWTPRWTGPIQAATILALLAELGHPDLMSDLNGDGVIDELDTILLADDFGTGAMKTETDVGTNDARLVIALAAYVALKYPGEFVLKIYDDGFPAEYREETGEAFDPAAIDGILLQLMGEPTLDGYKEELESLEGVIVGLEQVPHQNDPYLSGRSLLFDPTPEGYTPVDFAWSAEDRWEPGHQGQVLETVGRMDDRLFVEFRGDWVLVESMFALSPWDRPGLGDSSYDCPSNAIAYDVTETPTPHGRVEVEECVERIGDVDRYTWTVRNISYEVNGCGICMFAVPNPGLPIVDHSEPSGVAFSPSAWALRWYAHLGSCGILPGNSAVFSVSFPAPTIDVPVPGAVGGCVPAGPCALSTIPVDGIRTTGPRAMGDCPDLVVTIDDVSCVQEAVAGAAPNAYKLTVWLHVTNIGGAPVTVPTTVLLRGLGPYSGSMSDGPVPPLAPGATHAAILSFVVTADAPPCPLEFSVTADVHGAVVECDEDNTVFGSTCCTGVLQRLGACCYRDGSCSLTDEASCAAASGMFMGYGTTCDDCPGTSGCPDLIITIVRFDCDCDCTYLPNQQVACTYSITIVAEVTNIGSAPSPATSATAFPFGETESVDALDPSESDEITFRFDFGGGRTCAELEVPVIVEVDAVPGECDEENNTVSEEIDCP